MDTRGLELMKPILSIVGVICVLLTGLVSASEVESELRLARSALVSGEYSIAEQALTHAMNGGAREAAFLLAEAYWRQGKDQQLLDLAETRLEGRDKAVWWCRVLERRGHRDRAYDCWSCLGETERAQRALRTQALIQELAPGQEFSLRRASSRPNPR